MEFYERAELGGQTDNWVGPNVPCLLAFCRTAGFARVEFRGKLEHSACVACYRRWEPVEVNAIQAPVVQHIMHDRNFGINFRSDADEYIGAAFSASDASILDVKPEVSGFGVCPISVTAIGSGFYQANFKLPPGIGPGWHDVMVRLGDSERSAPQRIAVDMPVVVQRLAIMGIAENDTWVQGQVARGKSMALWIEGLPENIDVPNTRVMLDGRVLRVTHATRGQVNAVIPEDTDPGERVVTIEAGGVRATHLVTVL